MEIKLFAILATYFVLGAIIQVFSTRGKTKAETKQTWLKYFTYLVILFVLFASIIFSPPLFFYACLVIVALGYFELVRAFRLGRLAIWSAFCLSVLGVFTLCAYGFLRFAELERHLLLHTLFVVAAFDSFSQLGGKLLGKKKLVPRISPGKTYAGLIAGVLVALTVAALVGQVLNLSDAQIFGGGLGIILFAFLGDIAASAVKRKCGIKDFSQLIPGHGGVLDRFDSFILAGGFVFLGQLFVF